MIEIEPHPLLLEYIGEANALFCDFDGGKREFIDNDEWHYVPSNLEQNIYLLKRIDELGILPSEVDICDCGVGLGTTMFDFYLQSQELNDKKFTFTGIEKYTSYINFFNEKLSKYWNGKLNLIQGEIMEQNYSNYNFIYSYSPFKTEEKLIPYYSKLISEIKPNSIIVEFRNKGLGYEDTLLKFEEIERVEIDDISIFIKKPL
jgi:hypothetical protein